MGIYFNFPSGWWLLIAVCGGIYILAYLSREHKIRHELRLQAKVSFVVLVLALIIEFIGVSLGLWNYVPGNWPAILPFAYVIIGLAAYQVVRWLEEKVI